MTRPFDRLSRRVLVDNPWHKYCHDRYLQRDGSEGEYFYVDMPGSALVIPRLADGRVLLLRVHRYLLRTWLWEFPIGGLRPDEEPLELARKELLEEAGCRAARWTPLGCFAPYKGVSNERCHIFLAEELERGAQQLEASEEIEVHEVTLSTARERILALGPQADAQGANAQLGDGQSLAALAYLEQHERQSRQDQSPDPGHA